MTRYEMTRGNLCERRNFLTRPGFRVRTTRVESAATGRISWTRNLAWKEEAEVSSARALVCLRCEREKCLGVRVGRMLEKLFRRANLDELPEVHDSDSV